MDADMTKELESNKDYIKWLGDIKNQIRSSQQRASLKVNQELLSLYWYIGEALANKQTEWGDKFIDSLARDLKVEFPDVKGFSKSNLKYMRRWFEYYSERMEISQQAVDQLELSNDFSISQQAVDQLSENKIVQQAVAQNDDNKTLKFLALLFSIPWGHHIAIFTKTTTPEESLFYITKTIQNNWSRNILKTQIESDLYNRQGKALNNFQVTLPTPDSDLAQQMLKNPYNFDFLTLAEDAKEREFERALIQHIKKFLLELGKGFAYVGNQYNLNVEGDDFFLDLLFFNYNLNCFVIFELKVGDFKPEFAGKLNMYVNTVNDKVKLDHHKDTIGVLLCKTPNKTVIEYSIKNINAPIGVSDYDIKKALPSKLKQGMPTLKELEEELEKEIKVPENPVESKLNKLKSIIHSNGKEEVKQEKTPEIINKIIDKLYFPLIDSLSSRIEKELSPLYQKTEITYWTDGLGQNKIEGLKEEIKRKNHCSHIRAEFKLEGFKKAGLNAFSNRLTFKIELEDFKYTIVTENGKQECINKLYHQEITEQDISVLAEQMLEQLLDEINENAEKHLKNR